MTERTLTRVLSFCISVHQLNQDGNTYIDCQKHQKDPIIDDDKPLLLPCISRILFIIVQRRPVRGAVSKFAPMTACEMVRVLFSFPWHFFRPISHDGDRARSLSSSSRRRIPLRLTKLNLCGLSVSRAPSSEHFPWYRLRDAIFGIWAEQDAEG